MIWWICFLAAVLSIAAGTAGFLVRRRYGKSEVRYLGAGVFLACVLTCFPGMCLSEQPGFALAMSVSHSIRMFVVDTGVTDILELLPGAVPDALFYPYKILVCLLYLLAPVFTLSIVLRYFSNFFERLRLTARKRQDLYVFSDLNPRSLEIAADIRAGADRSGKKAAGFSRKCFGFCPKVLQESFFSAGAFLFLPRRHGAGYPRSYADSPT